MIITRKQSLSGLTGCNLNDICSHDIDALQPTDDRAKLSRGPPSCLRRTCSRRERRIQRIDINGEIHRVLVSDTIMDLLDDTLSTNSINLSSFGNLETAVPIVLVIRQPGERCANSGVDVGVVAKQALFRCMEKVCTVVDGGLLARCSAENLGAPCIEVGIKADEVSGQREQRKVDVVDILYDGYGAIRFVH